MWELKKVGDAGLTRTENKLGSKDGFWRAFLVPLILLTDWRRREKCR